LQSLGNYRKDSEFRVNIHTMKTIFTLLLAVTLSGCAQLQGLIPSFNDTNQSARIIDVRQAIAEINCEQPQLPQAQRVKSQIQWFELYSESRGRQSDVLALVKPIDDSVTEWIKRGEGTKGYCTLKKSILTQQAHRAAGAILGRF